MLTLISHFATKHFCDKNIVMKMAVCRKAIKHIYRFHAASMASTNHQWASKCRDFCFEAHQHQLMSKPYFSTLAKKHNFFPRHQLLHLSQPVIKSKSLSSTFIQDESRQIKYWETEFSDKNHTVDSKDKGCFNDASGTNDPDVYYASYYDSYTKYAISSDIPYKTYLPCHKPNTEQKNSKIEHTSDIVNGALFSNFQKSLANIPIDVESGEIYDNVADESGEIDDGHTPTLPVASSLTHIDNDTAKAKMVNVGGKDITNRIARATAIINVGPEAYKLVANNEIAKGNVLTVAQVLLIQ